MIAVTPNGGTSPYDAINPPQSVSVGVVNYPFSPLVPGVISVLKNATFSPQVVFRYVGPNAQDEGKLHQALTSLVRSARTGLGLRRRDKLPIIASFHLSLLNETYR